MDRPPPVLNITALQSEIALKFPELPNSNEALKGVLKEMKTQLSKGYGTSKGFRMETTALIENAINNYLVPFYSRMDIAKHSKNPNAAVLQNDYFQREQALHSEDFKTILTQYLPDMSQEDNNASLLAALNSLLEQEVQS